MAKKKTEVTEQELMVKTIVDASKMAEKLFIKETNATPEELKKITDTYSKIKIKNIDDLAGYKFVVQGEKDLKKLRTTIGKVRKTLTDPAIAFQKGMIAKEKEILEIIQPLENDLNAKKTDYEDKVQAAKNKLFTERCAELDKHGYQLNGGFYVCSAINIEADKIADLTNDEFDFYLQQGAEELKRIEAEETRKREEAEALQRERDELAAEREKMRLEREEFAKMKAEMEAQKLALEKTYETVENPVVDKNEVLEIQTPIEAVKEERLKQESENIVINSQAGRASGKMNAGKNVSTDNHLSDASQYVAPKPENVTASVEESQIEVGFNEMRNRVIALARNKQHTISRAIIIEWAEKQTIV